MIVRPERLQWIQKVLNERFGYSWQLAYTGGCYVLTLEGRPGNVLFDTLEPSFMQAGSASELHCEWWRLEAPWKSVLGEKSLPMPTSKSLSRPLVEKNGDNWVCHYDIPGLVFWCMNRLEEVGAKTLDEHQRFPASESHAEINGYLDRPIVDEWLAILGQIIQAQWPELSLREHQFEMLLSHDVDRPSRYGFRSIKGVARAMAGDLVKRGDLNSFLLAPWVRLNTRTKLHPMDTFNTFNWMMDQSDKAGVKSTFNFICDTDYGPYEADYQLGHPAIRRLIRDIYARGHLIGLHPSYQCYLSPDKIQREFERLQEICLEEGVYQSEWGGRMHYLRWSHPETLRAWEKAGLNYDSTLGFAGKAGFRCGTAHSFRPYDVHSETMMNIDERPLIAMEGTVLAEKYMGVKSHEEARAVFLDLKEKSRKVGGQFTLLWHNSELNTLNLRKLYTEVIR